MSILRSILFRQAVEVLYHGLCSLAYLSVKMGNGTEVHFFAQTLYWFLRWAIYTHFDRFLLRMILKSYFWIIILWTHIFFFSMQPTMITTYEKAQQWKPSDLQKRLDISLICSLSTNPKLKPANGCVTHAVNLKNLVKCVAITKEISVLA